MFFQSFTFYFKTLQFAGPKTILNNTHQMELVVVICCIRQSTQVSFFDWICCIQQESDFILVLHIVELGSQLWCTWQSSSSKNICSVKTNHLLWHSNKASRKTEHSYRDLERYYNPAEITLSMFQFSRQEEFGIWNLPFWSCVGKRLWYSLDRLSWCSRDRKAWPARWRVVGAMTALFLGNRATSPDGWSSIEPVPAKTHTRI